MRKLFIALWLLGLSGCRSCDPVDNARDFPGDFVYFKDWDADLCFVYKQYGDSAQGMMTNVPCTEKVMARIVNGAEAGR